MAFSLQTLFPSFFRAAGPMMPDGIDLIRLMNVATSSANGITAHAGGTQAAATVLTATFNEVTTCASDSDSVMLPPAYPGSSVWVINNTGHTLAVFGQTVNVNNANAGDTIAAHNSNTQQATATGVTQATTVPGIYVCTTLGQWKQYLG